MLCRKPVAFNRAFQEDSRNAVLRRPQLTDRTSLNSHPSGHTSWPGLPLPRTKWGRRWRRRLPRRWVFWFWKHARKVVVGVVGCSLLFLGILMLVLPGPGWATILAGLALLGSEFAWARWVLRRLREQVDDILDSAGQVLQHPTKDSSVSPRDSAPASTPNSTPPPPCTEAPSR
ncbi:MAG: hypothetical protein KatS3mg114_1249 [Planctomycetaceae bacterium]|nr:MAG: hypothetical protein KatS3mg114_1249 [Planctomycetaceae bacterium]